MFIFSVINMFSSVIYFLGQSSNADFIIQCKHLWDGKKRLQNTICMLKFPGRDGRLRYMYGSCHLAHAA